MISIRKSVDDLSRLEELEKREALSSVVRECYALAIHSAAHYAVEIDPGLTVELRTNLKTIEDQSRTAVSTRSVSRGAVVAFEANFREYRDKSTAQLVKMREVESRHRLP